MLFEKRYVFNGHTVAAAAHIRRFQQEPVQLDTTFEGSAALPQTGGSLQSQSGRRVVAHPQHGFVMSFDSAKGAISGDFINTQLAFEHTLQKNIDQTSPVRVTTEASVAKLNVQNRLLIGNLDLRTAWEDANGRSPAHFSFPALPQLTDVNIDGKAVVFDIDPTLLRFPNKTALETEYQRNPDFRKLYANRFYTPTDAPPGNMIPLIKDFAVASFVRDISFPDGMPQGAKKLNPNTLVLNNFGTIVFGEYFLGDRKRIVTVLRLEMGSDWGGDASFGCCTSNPVGDTMP